MKLLVWNIQQGGGRRRGQIADAIVAHKPDIVALVEFVPSTAEPLLQSLRESGFRHDVRTNRNGFDYAYRIEHTWRRGGKSYRIDHALASSGLLPRIRDCRYSHEERYEGVSDHSLLLVEIED